MKRLILFEIIILFLATTFESDSPPPGWFQQTLPRTDVIVQDLFFIDSLNGWTAAVNYPAEDTSFVFKTTNGGINWIEQYRLNARFNTIQFLDNNTGYISGGTGFGRIFKTVNSGVNWNIVYTAGLIFVDLYFINKDTGWVCDEDSFVGAGLQKTTNGGVSWIQLLPRTYRPSKLFFINRDTGWSACNMTQLYRTTNGGTNWELQFNFPQQINDIIFNNIYYGVITSGFNFKTSNGGFNWTQSNQGGIKVSIGSDSVLWAGTNIFQKINKTTNGGTTWFYQVSPLANNSYTSTIDSLTSWAGGSGVIHTTDGGGPPVGIQQISSELPFDYKLYQNYPNPFNPKTIIRFQINRLSDVKIIVFDVQGREITELVNKQQTAGTYTVDWNAVKYSSGVYFYSLVIDGRTVDTKRMILIK